MIKKLLLGAFVTVTANMFGQTPMTPSSSAITAGSNWTTTKITSDNALDFPWEVTYGPDGDLWITERSGTGNSSQWESGGQKIVKVSTATATNTPTTLIDLSSKVTVSKQGGLMGMAIHPDLYDDITTTTNNYVFVSYSYDDGGDLKVRIVRLIYNNATGLLTEDTSLNPNGAIIEGLPGSDDHNSGRLKFGPDDKLYYSIGDQGANQFGNYCDPILAQTLPSSATDFDNYPGKTLRMEIDGSVPTDNPTLNSVKTHVYTYGHRNPQGLVFAQDGSLYSSEHGPKTDDELNKIVSGKNYGWPEIAGYYDNMGYQYCNWSSASNCSSQTFSNDGCPTGDGATNATEFESYPSGAPSNFENPIGTYNSTVASEPSGSYFTWPGVAPASIDIHEAGSIPCWNKSLLIPTLKRGTIFRAKLNTAGDDIVDDFYEEFHSSNDRYRDIAISPDGLTIYAVTDNTGGTSGPSSTGGVSIQNPGVIIKIEYVGPAVTDPITTPTLDDIVTYCPITLTAPTVLSNASDCQDIVGTTTDPTTYSSGSHVVTWSFDDNGTIVTANQNVTVNALQAPSNVSANPNTTTAEISWDNIDNVSFEVRYRAQGASSWLTETTSASSITLTGLTLSTTYEYQVRSDCGASQSSYTTLDTFTTNALSYCSAQGVNGGHISNVAIFGESGTSIINGSSGNTDYTDFTAVTPVNLNADGATSYTLNVSTSYNQSGVAVWIDLNQDGDFDDSGEKVWNDASGTNSNSPRSNSFTIPLSALNGNTRMRVASRQYWTPSGPCGTVVEAGQNSEVEDYTVNIVNYTLSNTDNLISSFMVYPNPIENRLNIKIPQEYTVNNLNVELHDIQGRIIKQINAHSSNITINNLNTLSKGVYFIRFKDAKGVIGSKKLIKM